MVSPKLKREAETTGPRRFRLWKKWIFATIGLLVVVIGLLFTPPFEEAKYMIWGWMALHTQLKGKLEKLYLDAPSLGLGQKRECWVYLPPGFSPLLSPRYPVVVLMHGAPGAPEDWVFKGNAGPMVDQLIASRILPPCILVIPDGRGIGPMRTSLWIDAVGNPPGGALETFLVRDLPEQVIARFHANPDPRAWTAAGLSTGAFGAANLVCRHPERYRSAVALSGFYEPDSKAEAERVLLGSDTTLRAAYAPQQTVARLHPPADYFFALAVGRDDHYDRGKTARFATRLKELGIPYESVSLPGGHKWGFWQEALEACLPKAAAHWPIQDAKRQSEISRERSEKETSDGH